MPIEDLHALIQAKLEHQDHLQGATQVSSKMANWGLSGCCTDAQSTLIGVVCGYSVVIFLLWGTPVLAPFKLITVFLHEFGHASAAWLTGGKVISMEVHRDEGGVTKTQGGWMWVILPAGYLGSSFWGMTFIITSVNYYSVQVMAGLFVVALLIVLYLADNNSLRLLTLFFLLLLAAMWACEVATTFPGLRYFLLFVGTMSGWFSIYDIYDDLIRRKVHESDATQFAKLTHTSSRCWGLIWAIISTGFMSLGIYLALVILAPSNS